LCNSNVLSSGRLSTSISTSSTAPKIPKEIFFKETQSKKEKDDRDRHKIHNAIAKHSILNCGYNIQKYVREREMTTKEKNSNRKPDLDSWTLFYFSLYFFLFIFTRFPTILLLLKLSAMNTNNVTLNEILLEMVAWGLVQNQYVKNCSR
jgi:hypothetical protein